MKRKLALLVLLIGFAQTTFGQQLFAIKATSNWNDGTAWSATSGGAACGCTPTASDDVYTDGNLVVVNVSGSCKNLFVNFDIANSLTINSFLTLTVTGSLTGWDPSGPSPSPPTAAVIKWNVGSTLKFTGANVATFEPYVIFAWTADQAIGTTNFALAGTSMNLLLPLVFNGAVSITGGTLTADAGASISGSSNFSISSGANYVSGDPIGPFNGVTVTGNLNLQAVSASLDANNLSIASGGMVNASGTIDVVNTVTISGSLNSSNSVSAGNLTINSLGAYTPSGSTSISNTLTVNSGGQINAAGAITTLTSQISGTVSTSGFFDVTGGLTLNAGSTLSTSYAGGTQGWWSGTNSPSSLNIDPASTVVFSSNSAQNLYTQEYGNLTLSGSGTKTVTGGGTLNVKGNLTVGSPFNSDGAGAINIGGNLANNQTWSPADAIIFNGTGSQQISGSVLPTFNGGLQVNKSGGTLSLLRSIQITNGLTVSQGTFDASNHTITLSGALSNSGTLSFGTGASLGTLVISGTTSVSGAVPSFGNLTVNGGSSFTSAGTVNIAGDVSNNGTFNVNGIVFNGTTQQDVSGTLTLASLTAQTGANVSNLGTINMSAAGVVTLDGTATFNAGSGGANTLRLTSTSLANGARIAPLPNPNLFSGNVTVERYINAPEDWRYISIPVVGANVGMIKDDMEVTGNFSDPSPVGGNVVNSTSPSIFFLNAGQWQAVGSGGTTTATSLSNTTGYSVWTYLDVGVSLDVDGEIGKGPVGITINSGDNLIPNPYPSAIDWDLVNLSNASLVTNSVYLRTANGQYATYLQGGGTSTGHPSLGGSWAGQLASGQSFWVVANGSGNITFQEDDKIASTNFVRESAPENYLRIRLHKDDISDDVVIHFREGATIEKDVQFDALKKLNDVALNISTYNTDPLIHYAINGVPFIQCQYTAKVKLGDTNPQGNYSLAFEDLNRMNVGYEMVLIDKFLNDEINITADLKYSFSITSDPASAGANRFEIVFKTPEIDLARELSMEGAVDCDASAAKVSIHNSQPGISYQFLMDGSVLSAPVVGNGGSIEVYIPKDALSYGLNSLNLLAISQNACHSHEFTNAFSLSYDAVPEATALSSVPVCNEGSALLNASGAPEGGFYKWYETEDSLSPIEGVNTAQYVTPLLTKSKTYFVSAVNTSGCEGSRIAISAEVVHVDIPAISVQGDIFTVPDNMGTYQWHFNDEPVDGATSSTYQVKISGTYSVAITLNGCSVRSEGMEFLINGNEHKAAADYYDLYPNPIEDVVTVEGPDLGLSKITVYDRAGQQLDVEGRFDVNADGETVFIADFKHFRNGVYLLNIQNPKQVVQLKVIKR